MPYLRPFLPTLFTLLLLSAGLRSMSQHQPDFVDSLKGRLAVAKTAAEKVDLLIGLANSSLDPGQAHALGDQAIAEAELSRDRRLMATAYIQNGKNYLHNGGLSDNLDHAMKNFEQAEQLARDNGLGKLLVDSYCGLSSVWEFKGNNQKELAYSNQAMAMAGNTDNDTARTRAYASLGETYMSMNEMLLSLQNFLAALNIAETSGKEGLVRDIYMDLQRFYYAIHEYAKGVDYGMKAYALDRQAWSSVNMMLDLYNIGDMYVESKQPAMAMRFYENSFRLSDTLHMPFMKFNSYFRIFNMYFRENEFSKGLKYIGDHREILNFLDSIGAQFFVGEIYAMAMTERGKYDSAGYYFRQAEPGVERNGNPEMQYDFFVGYGNYYGITKDFPDAIRWYKKALDVATLSQGLEWEAGCADTLQGLYEKTGDYKSALFYATRSNIARDSIRTQLRATDLMKLEVENDSRRRERIAREEEEKTERRHNVQYMGFTVGLVVLFIGLVMLGRLDVPLSLVRALGFLSFVFLFEFVILLLDKKIQVWTHEEPWKVLLIKIALGAILVPLHHWLEHKVIHYLSSRRKPHGNGAAGDGQGAGHGQIADHGQGSGHGQVADHGQIAGGGRGADQRAAG